MTWVGKNSPAEKMGLKFGDQIMSWMGQTGFNQKTIISAMNKSKPKDKIWAIVKRNEQEIHLNSIAPLYIK